ncbi:MAG: flagellar hook protein FlgE [Alphaproteobacteria bacterium]|nr:flagellar hook protein FlgE [Alphaproteobacteria bacterium]
MSLFGAMRSGVSGLFAQSQAIAMVADNIANLNTTGYKEVSPRFSTLVTTQSSQNSFTPGGVQLNTLNGIDQQGLLEASAVATDIAISGDGFFVASTDSTTGAGAVRFTRAGSFRADADGNLVNTAGLFLTGWPITNGVVQQTSVLNALTTINVANLTSAPIASSTVNLGANLPSTAATGDAFNLSVQTLDKQGGQHTAVYTYTKTATANAWDVTITITDASFVDPDTNNDGTNVAALIAGTTSTRLGTMTFGADGTLASVTADSTAGDIATVNADNEFVFDIDYDNNLATGAAADRVALTTNHGTAGQANGFTQFAGTFVPNFITQNGRQFGSATGVSIGEDGKVSALFDNGETREVFQIPLAVFPNPNALTPVTGNSFSANDAAGNAIPREANTGGAGSVAPRALEASTVDLANEFTKMIITQRAFSANTRVITTADEMLDELTRIIR